MGMDFFHAANGHGSDVIGEEWNAKAFSREETSQRISRPANTGKSHL